MNMALENPNWQVGQIHLKTKEVDGQRGVLGLPIRVTLRTKRVDFWRRLVNTCVGCWIETPIQSEPAQRDVVWYSSCVEIEVGVTTGWSRPSKGYRTDVFNL